MASRNPKNNLKTLLAAYRTTMDNVTETLTEYSYDLGLHPDSRTSAESIPAMTKIVQAVLADMRAEDEATKKAAE